MMVVEDTTPAHVLRGMAKSDTLFTVPSPSLRLLMKPVAP
jgi:hypothetical protein